MKYYDNGIYPIALVLSNDIESVRKEYNHADGNPIEHKLTSQATTYPVTRKNVDYFVKAGIFTQIVHNFFVDIIFYSSYNENR